MNLITEQCCISIFISIQCSKMMCMASLCDRKSHDPIAMLTSALGEGDAEEVTGSLRNSRRD